MARHKSYVREEAVAKARDAFWEHGYRVLGIRAIEDIVGVGRFAIRTEFDGKEGLFVEALRAYREAGRIHVIGPIEAGEGLSALEDLLAGVITPYEGDCRQYGCLFVNTIVENATMKNPRVKELTSGHFGDVRAATIRLIERAKAKSEVREDVDAEAAGDFIVGTLMAVGLISRDAQDATAARGYVEMAKATISSWRRKVE